MVFIVVVEPALDSPKGAGGGACVCLHVLCGSGESKQIITALQLYYSTDCGCSFTCCSEEKFHVSGPNT